VGEVHRDLLELKKQLSSQNFLLSFGSAQVRKRACCSGVGQPSSMKLLIVHFPQPHPNAFSCNSSSENMPLLLVLSYDFSSFFFNC